MHGIIHLELRKYVEARHEPTAWPTLLAQAGVAPTLEYIRVGDYPGDELTLIVAAVSRDTDAATRAILEDFGEFIAPGPGHVSAPDQGLRTAGGSAAPEP